MVTPLYIIHATCSSNSVGIIMCRYVSKCVCYAKPVQYIGIKVELCILYRRNHFNEVKDIMFTQFHVKCVINISSKRKYIYPDGMAMTWLYSYTSFDKRVVKYMDKLSLFVKCEGVELSCILALF